MGQRSMSWKVISTAVETQNSTAVEITFQLIER